MRQRYPELRIGQVETSHEPTNGTPMAMAGTMRTTSAPVTNTRPARVRYRTTPYAAGTAKTIEMAVARAAMTMLFPKAFTIPGCLSTDDSWRT